MIIKLPGDTSLWHFIPAYLDTTVNDIPRYFGKLITKSDSVIIQYTVGFKNVKKLYHGSLYIFLTEIICKDRIIIYKMLMF